MNKIIKLTLLTATVLAMAACSDENTAFEDRDLSDYFMPASDATDQVSQMRRQFKEEEGSYLIFNDTLQHYYIGTDINGEKQYFTELLDIKYQVGGQVSAGNPYTYTYLDTPEKKIEATNYLKNFILCHLSVQLRPFSWFLCGTITGTNTSGYTIKPYAISGERGIVLACDQLKSLKNDTQKQQLANRHLLGIVGNVANNNKATFADFSEIVSQYYQKDLNKPEGMSANDYVRSLGFASSTNVISFPSQDDDISAFATIVITYTEEQVERTYAKYPLIIQRAKLFRADLVKLGYIF